ncbi:hypothetical protein [Shimia ponticola]|uniref:hypothetical protein n=1 Tax=Shimia ponticola TaxID=2582893 RepID=UPI0011BEB7D0|nr:hypothetical protein [Shimia ponticola]
MPARKIATCCYCGTRAALVLAGDKSHELACSSCGAPLHDLKMLPKSALEAPMELVKPSRVRKTTKPKAGYKNSHKKPKKRKKKKSLGAKLFSEAFDIIEDIFD